MAEKHRPTVTTKTLITHGIYDFEVTQPVPGQSVNVVIPLGEPMPAGAVYRKYTEATGWVEFVVDENNATPQRPVMEELARMRVMKPISRVSTKVTPACS